MNPLELTAFLLFIGFCLFVALQVWRHEVRPYRGVRPCSCHPRRPRVGRIFPHPPRGPAKWKA